ncbi:hypothetical protein [Methylobacterium sp. OT2]|uniref:hypothetical protein n=1 Tax=Methylobacterium sp. OT2 TaxID=2813779 RepID=UPI001FEFC965|nr:hypothetical protein [Methylobacterium sp. OT2]
MPGARSARCCVGAAGEGARAACLQVVAANTPARALYRALGFERELYRYHYRVGPEPG